VKKVLGIGCLGFLVLVLGLFGYLATTPGGRALWANRAALTEGMDEYELAKSKDGVVQLMAAHPERVSLAVWSLEDPDGGVFFDADRVRPLASTAKIVVGATLASAFVGGAASPDSEVKVEDLERFYLPGTDGNAHPEAMKSLGNPPAVKLKDVAAVMLHFSDNAATDFLMITLGRPALEAEVARLGIAGVFPPAPYSGHLLALVESGKATGALDVDGDWARARRLQDDATWAAGLREKLTADGLPPVAEQKAHRGSSPARGSARGYAELMAHIATDQTKWGEWMRTWLSWPMKNESMKKEFAQFGTKGGSTASVVTSASFAQPHGGGVSVLALFMEDLPLLPWVELMKTYKHQDVERSLLVDADFRRQVSDTLRVADGGR
jgi:D-alanyl-D-alanine carboxypeptidase